ncbi:hypothetical protein ACQPZJ_43635 [Actinoplanes sp. CA-054009]
MDQFLERAMLNLLYYPKIEPPHRWLRQTLLLADSVGIFVPSADDLGFTDRLSSLQESLPVGALREVVAEPNDVKLPPENEFYLDRALHLIASEPRSSSHRVIFEGSGARIGGYVFVHSSKFTDKSFEMLTQYDLAGPKRDKIARNLLPGLVPEGWHSVEERAADLVIACAAEQASQRHKLHTITDDPLAFGVTALPTAAVGDTRADSAIAGALARFYIPKEVEDLEIGVYLEVRESLAELRGGIDKLIRTLRQQHWDDKGQMADLQAAIADFDEQCRKYRRTAVAVRVGQWTTLVVGTLIAAALPLVVDPEFAAAGGGGAFALERLVDRFVVRGSAPSHFDTYKLLAGVKPTIMQSAHVDRLAG